MLPSRLFGAVLVLSQLMAPRAGAQQYAFQEDGQNKGLNSLTINCLLQDHTGVVWVCTENGLYEFDGSRYIRKGAEQGLIDSYILSIQEDPSGELWVGTVNRLYHGNEKHFTALAAPSGDLLMSAGQQLDATAAGRVLAVSQHRLFEAARAKLGGSWSVEPFFSQTALEAHPQLNTINSVYTGRDGSVWMGCGSAICQMAGKNIRVWDAKDGVTADTWSWFLEDSAGRLWARGYRHILQLSPHSARFANEDISPAPVTFNSPLLPIVEDAHHRIVTRTDRGLAIWNQGLWQTLGAGNGLSGPGILALMTDRDGILWLGTYGRGVERWLGNGNWETWGPEQGLAGNMVWMMRRDHWGTMWAATEHGIVTLDRAGGRLVPWHPDASVPRGQVISVQEAPDHGLWFSSLSGQILHYAPNTGKMQHWRMPSGTRAVWQDSSKRVWSLANSGLYAFNQARPGIVKVSNPAVPDSVYYDVCEDSSHGLWFASHGGLVHFSGGRWSKIKVLGKDTSDGFATVACAADGTLWLGGASTGVTHLRVQGDVATAAEPQPPSELDSVEVMFLRFDRRGWLWTGSGFGVFVFNGTRWRHFTEKDGLAWNDCNEGAFLDDTDGTIWIGTSNGLSHLLHPADTFDQSALRIVFTSAMLGKQPVPAGAAASFAWSREPLQVHVASLPFDDRSSIVYRYRLLGLERDWVETGSPDLRYSALPGGTYRLEVYAEDADRGIRSPVAVLSFRVRPPWWKSLPFQMAVGAALLLLIYAFLRYRERELVARQTRLETLVSERTEELELEKQQLTQAREALREQATRDALTGLLNRGAIFEILNREMTRSRRDGSTLTAVMIDMDHFKAINDTQGHMVGDEVLREVAHRLAASIRPYDAAGRLGGEEFLLVMPDFDAVKEPDRLTAVHNAVCLEPVQSTGGEIRVTCSFGVSILSGDRAVKAEHFLDRADKALYEAKRAGRNRIEYDQS
ncbi:MAG: diguanylate cyclase [Terracidiphilus sp.]